MTSSRGCPLRLYEERVFGRVLTWVKAKAVDAVDDDRDPRRPGRSSAQDPGLAAVGVDDERPRIVARCLVCPSSLLQPHHQLGQAACVAPRPHRPYQAGQELAIELGDLGGFRVEDAPAARPKADSKSAPIKASAGGEGVLLRPTKLQLGDDVDDRDHPRASIRSTIRVSYFRSF
jgi:hypothetical protein